MRGDGVTVRETPIRRRQCATVRERDAVLAKRLDLDAFAIGEPSGIGLKEQPIAGSDRQLPDFADIESGRHPRRVHDGRSPVRAAQDERAAAHRFDGGELAGAKLPGFFGEAQLQARLVTLGQAFLRIGPPERIENRDRLVARRDRATLLQLAAHATGDGLNLAPGGRDEESRLAGIDGL